MNIDKYYILVAEGVTDCSLLEAMIENYMGYKPFQNVKELPPLFEAMIGKYPTMSGELARQDSPTFYYKEHIGIAIKQANGYSKIPIKVTSLIENIDKFDMYGKFGGFLIFCDTDLKTKQDTVDIFTKIFADNELRFDNGYLITDDNNKIKCELYCFPNDGQGAVEKLLLECADVSYHELFEAAGHYKDKIMQDTYSDIRKKCWAKDSKIQQFYSDKVQFGAMSVVLKPDKPVRFTIKDKLIRECYYDEYRKISEFEQLYNFLENMLK